MRTILAFLFSISFILCNSQNANDVLGFYMNPSGEGIIKVFEDHGKYHGKLVWMKNPEKLDKNNPDKNKQGQKILGSVIFKDFIYAGDNLWKDGSIYDPKNGKTYDCKITRDEKGNLNIRGFIGISLIGRTEYFVKVNFKE
jgi:uncharacterized protein (DUF2147 family)